MCQVELILTLLIFLLVVLLKRIFIHLKVVGRNLFILKKKMLVFVVKLHVVLNQHSIFYKFIQLICF